ncbi:hypothetical protein H2248_007691 [Termitomyces sp. 'cryptogamus']|nr:hypothetical protein H2248_007691 [Termitomyces sp. 'cryptogamus']
MNSVYFPAHVVLVLRRIVNVLSSISISNQYILLKQAQADEERAKLHVINSKSSSALLDQEWPSLTSLKSWDWRRTLNLAASSVNADSGSPQIGSGWSWPALLSTFTQMDLPMANDPLPPLKSQKNNRGPDTQRRLPLPETTKAAPPDTIHQLMQNPALCDPFRIPRYPLVLCHGKFSLSSRSTNILMLLRTLRIRFAWTTEVPKYEDALLV